MASKSSFLDKVLGRVGRLDTEGLQSVVQRLARERTFLETLFNAIEDGVLVLDENGRIIYFNQSVTRLLNWPTDGVEGRPITEFLPELDWKSITAPAPEGGPRVTHHEFELAYPRPRFMRFYAAPLDGESRGGSGTALILHDATEARQRRPASATPPMTTSARVPGSGTDVVEKVMSSSSICSGELVSKAVNSSCPVWPA